jgi:hypothetical protein
MQLFLVDLSYFYCYAYIYRSGYFFFVMIVTLIWIWILILIFCFLLLLLLLFLQRAQREKIKEFAKAVREAQMTAKQAEPKDPEPKPETKQDKVCCLFPRSSAVGFFCYLLFIIW